ncbi:MAG: proline racemase family protein [Rhodospirillales bacterium]|nr:proline racemase family protein [Rhodospirillales bacterium]
MHTGGEPVRIIENGFPTLRGRTLLAKRRYLRDHFDHLRKFLMFEPRGHFDMYGVIAVEPDHPDADLAVLFMHNEGYSTMCGHAVIALGRYAVDKGLVKAREPETEVRIQCPCGLVTVQVEVNNGATGRVRFESVPGFVLHRQKIVATAAHGPVEVDIAYGGAFYAFVAADQFGLDVRRSRVRDLVDVANVISAAVKEQLEISHPDDPDLGFLYGTILTDGADAYSPTPTANICVFADSQVDRSPTGSGVTARIALQYRKGQINLGQTRTFESVTGALFEARAMRESTVGRHKAVTVEVAGRAHYTGSATFSHEPDDEIGRGFLLR